MVGAEQLAGNPPRYFLIGARLFGVEPTWTVVVEDAVSGLPAELSGNFGPVIGIARRGTLKRYGAHLVLNDLGELVG